MSRYATGALMLCCLLVVGCGSSMSDTREGSAYEVALPGGWADDTDGAEAAETPIRFDSLLRKEPEKGFVRRDAFEDDITEYDEILDSWSWD